MRRHERASVPREADERETLLGYLRFHRDTLVWKCAGLTHDQMRRRPLRSSELSILGLVRHMAECERRWLANAVNGEDRPAHWRAPFETRRADPAEAFAVWHAEGANSLAMLATADLDRVVDHTEDGERHRFSVRWVVLHVLEEYARHNGHADLLRQAVDGATGD